MKLHFHEYEPKGFYDELFLFNKVPRPETEYFVSKINHLSVKELSTYQKAAELALLELGITFNLNEPDSDTERIFPFDIIPRFIAHSEWAMLERGLKQRVFALNLFLTDIYGSQNILKDHLIPTEVITSGEGFNRYFLDFIPKHSIWCPISGIDLVRDEKGQFWVLEDNLRCPSGVSYVIKNRQVMKRTFPSIFDTMSIRSVEDYPLRLQDTLRFISPDGVNNPTIVLLTPGLYNSAYFEHTFLAQQMGIELVEGRDLIVHEGYVWMRTTKQLKRVDVIYRRIDEDFLDPLVFRKESLLGVPGLMNVYKEGRVAIVNAPGTGIGDDKAVYSYVPDMIRYYLKEDPILPNVPTYQCWKKNDREHVLTHMDTLVIKNANGSGGYGMLIGPNASHEDITHFKSRIMENPRNFIAQPIVKLSRVPTIIGETIEGRHVDFRPYVLYGEDLYVLPGGLTRVALQEGSLVVNSSQGGGSKDTWVINPC